jgi:putative SOS response-associated peptidase YedK
MLVFSKRRRRTVVLILPSERGIAMQKLRVFETSNVQGRLCSAAPVDGFFERRATKKRAKQPYATAMKDGSAVGQAGLWGELAQAGPTAEMLSCRRICTDKLNRTKTYHVLTRDPFHRGAGLTPSSAQNKKQATVTESFKTPACKTRKGRESCQAIHTNAA